MSFLVEAAETISVEEAFPEYASNPIGTALSGYRHRERLTQIELSERTGVPQRHPARWPITWTG